MVGFSSADAVCGDRSLAIQDDSSEIKQSIHRYGRVILRLSVVLNPLEDAPSFFVRTTLSTFFSSSFVPCWFDTPL